MSDELKHIGTPRHSGRYPWGSGENPEQRGRSFRGHILELKRKGLKDTEIAEELGINTSKLREMKSIEKDAQRLADSAEATRLHDKGLSNVAIGARMGKNESSIRALLNPTLQERAAIAKTTADLIKTRCDEMKYIDVGLGTEIHLGISQTKLKTALAMLKQEGYEVHYVQVEQLGTGKFTSLRVLAPPGVDYKEVYANRDKIKLIRDFTEDQGRNWQGIETPVPVNADRVHIRYNEEGGKDKDGLIELRRGVPDISLGNDRYAQVRISVNGTHFMKGMAVYSDDIPTGKDIVYNTSKHIGVDKMDVFKSNKSDNENPFGATIRQRKYKDKDGKEHLSALNLVNEEGDWEDWKKTISSQVLSKQSTSLAKKQLGIDADRRKSEFDELLSLTNPAIKRRLLKTFSDNCDKAAVDLKAAAMPRQSSHVILPFKTIKPTEIFAPNFEQGENVVLIRHPHGGIFEIPELIVNNKNPEALKVLGKNAIDAVGIHPSVAEKLSGADFDGDTVLVIPNKNRDIKTAPKLRALSDFDPKELYKHYEGMPRMTDRMKQQKMGEVSNLITDMTIKGADTDEIARAVRHSMVVIDAEKHYLDYKRSAIDHNIADLKRKYQGGPNAGASTLISKAGSEIRVAARNDFILDPASIYTDPVTGQIKGKRISIDPVTGKKLYSPTGETYQVPVGPHEIDPVTGAKKYLTSQKKTMIKTISSTKMAETDDANTLSSGTKMEKIYADYANEMKRLANEARKNMLNIKDIIYSPQSRVAYSKEVESLNAKLALVINMKPFERQAQLVANSRLLAKKQANPQLTAGDIKKLKGRLLQGARSEKQFVKEPIKITDREWEAIQAGAITKSKLEQILLNTDLDVLKERALPKHQTNVSTNSLNRAKAMMAKGNTNSEIAEALGVSVSTVKKILSEEG